jgi:hypothetical protein
MYAHLVLEAEHGAAALAGVAVVLDGVHDVLVPPAVVRDPVPDNIIVNYINLILLYIYSMVYFINQKRARCGA